MLSIINGGMLSEAGMRMIYRKDNKRFDLQISPIIGNVNQFLLHLNIHYDKKEIKNFDFFQDQFIQGYLETQRITNQLEK